MHLPFNYYVTRMNYCLPPIVVQKCRIILEMASLTRFLFSPFPLLTFFVLQSKQELFTNEDSKHIKFYLYPKTGDSNYRQEIIPGIDSSLAEASFKARQLTVILVHSYDHAADSRHVKAFLDAYLNSSFVANYIVMDWTRLVGKITLPTDNLIAYPLATSTVPLAAEHLAQFISWLTSSQVLDPTRVHLIGISLGAHIVGQAGRRVSKAMAGFKLARITGLEPAGLLFFPPDPSRNLGKEDAHFVDIIHTNAGMAGELTTEGHVDFIVNGGTSQPGCDPVSNLASSCSHDFAEKLFVKSFSVSYFGCKCSSETGNLVGLQQCGTDCRDPVRVGLYTPHNARGTYSVTTGKI